MTKHISEVVNFIILAAGNGSRMKSTIPKAMHCLGGEPFILHLINKINNFDLPVNKSIAVISPNSDEVENSIKGKIDYCYQDQPLGTAHAVLSAKKEMHSAPGITIILYVDTPMVDFEYIKNIYHTILSEQAQMCVLGFVEHKVNNSYGRLDLVDNKYITKIVEAKDANYDELSIPYCNSGIIGVRNELLWQLLPLIKKGNAQGEYYLTDIVEHANKLGNKVHYINGDKDKLVGANSKYELYQLEKQFQEDCRLQAMEQGVYMQDPDSIYFSPYVKFGKGVCIEPNVMFRGRVSLGDNVMIKSFSYLEDCSVDNDACIGPFAHLRVGSEVKNNAKVGSFVEVKQSIIGSGSKAAHLSYIGNTVISSNVNIGAGCITCNYDGQNKSSVYIDDNSFIGANSSLIAPVKIGKHVTIGAGSVITKDVPDQHLGISRAEQVIKYYNKNKS